MSSFTNGLNMPLLTPGLAGHIPHNDALVVLDTIVGRGILGATNNAPGSPANWDTYIVFGAPDSGNAWYGHENALAIFYNNQWRFVTPKHGLRVWNRNESTTWVFGVSTWSVMGAGQACAAGHNSGGLTTTTTWGQVTVDSSDLLPADSFSRGAGAGDFIVATAGSYMVELNAQIEAAGGAVVAELAFAVNGGASSVTPLAQTVRRHSIASGDFASVHALAVIQLGAGEYVAPLWQRVSGAGTATLAATLSQFRLTKLSP